MVLTTNETALVITYRAKVNSWLAIQPVVQRIYSLDFNPAVDYA